MEIWKDVKGYAGYQVSNLGNVRSYNKVTSNKLYNKRVWENRVLAQKKDKTNSLRVDLWNNGQHKTWLVHRLVAIAFLGEPENENMTVNHKDGNRLNNNVENLEWLTLGDNIRHGFANDLYSCQTHCTLMDESGQKYNFKSLTKANSFLNRSRTYIQCCVRYNRAIRSKSGEIYQVEVLGG